MSTKSRGACIACRTLKVKCVPGTRGCARCTALEIRDCRYAPVKKRGAGNVLGMNQACIPCRQKKSKCDAELPCATCVKKDRGAACTYDGSRSDNNVTLRPSRSPPRDVLALALSDSGDPGTSLPPPFDLHERPLTAPERLLWKYSADRSVVKRASGATEYPPSPVVSPLTTLPSTRFQTIPRPLQMPLLDIHPEHAQVSSVALNDMDMILYVFSPVSVARGTEGKVFGSRLKGLCQMHKLGLYFTQEKQAAILRGDTSNSVLHRNFVDSTQVMGMYLCAPKQTPYMVRLEASYVQRSWESLVELNQTNQERAKAQALVRVAHSAVILGFNAAAQLYFSKACKIIEKAKLQFLPEYGPPAEFSEEVREEASVLSQAIFLENYFYLTMGGPAPVKTAGIEKEFRLDLQRVYPCLFKICPLTMRTQSILLVRDAIHILNSPVDHKEKTSDQRKSCLHLVHALDTFSSALMENLEQFISIGDTCGVWMIWSCCIMCLAHLAALCHLMSQEEPALSTPMNGLYDLALGKLCNLSLEVRIEQYSHFDVLTGMSWKTALDTIEARIGLHAGSENEPLGPWKMTIEKAYADFRENIPAFEPDLFASLVFATDGRPEGSNFPNLIVPTERERYGL
ncbi:hypothetical protein BJ322DRAFT_1168073 [Thelephora terrestris]|uniref:Zn(2)-C6 fungal-type domain-containing protein n=1 Tax=Thelephora terrestris TaxID=56493 RepID=A0A9P6H787_9AGAM|nr:hypothetical protein BJ322DRAFT_1168073 [Thelephora terrestris]